MINESYILNEITKLNDLEDMTPILSLVVQALVQHLHDLDEVLPEEHHWVRGTVDP